MYEINPKSGPLNGGTRITVHGANFINNEHVRCWFGNESSLAYYVNSMTMECTVPTISTTNNNNNNNNIRQNIQNVPFSLNEFYTLESSLTDVSTTTSTQLYYHFYTEPVLLTLLPVVIHEHTTSQIRIKGNGFRLEDANNNNNNNEMPILLFHSFIRCKTVYDESIAVLLDEHTIECDVTVGNPGQNVEISVSMNNGHNWITQKLSIQVISALTVTNLFPKIGYLVAGAGFYSKNTIQVYGSGFENTSTLICMFGTRRATWQTYISRTQVDCGVPSFTYPTIQHVSISTE